MLVIAHRGASAYRPEHTLGAYRLAIAMGADYIEPDLVATSDGVLVARHENEISGTTDVAARPEFASRRATKTIDGRELSGWFTEDFTLAELRTLRTVERLPELRPANTEFDGLEPVPTFDEVLELALRAGVGIYPETKHPTYFRSIGLPLEEPLLAALRAAGLAERSSPVFIQSFEDGNLRALRDEIPVRLVQLTGVPVDLRAVARYADAIGPEKGLVDGALVEDAHRAGLLVHPYTFRPESAFLPDGLTTEAELRRFYRLGVDGVFADHPDVAVASRR